IVPMFRCGFVLSKCSFAILVTLPAEVIMIQRYCPVGPDFIIRPFMLKETRNVSPGSPISTPGADFRT
ncbi:MAG TPA: hypothetical protein PLY83_03425, partial [Synergistales bacterium]|nr:hypothetical protein [Synergistales bacterium]